MAVHMSIKLAWHSNGWNGHICQKPCENTYCTGAHSYPANLKRDLEFEMEHAGEACSGLPCGAACGLSVNAFGKDTIAAKIDPPHFWRESIDPIHITLPPSTACTWCYEEMYNEEVKAKDVSGKKYDYDKRLEGAERYFAEFEPGKSLVFYYAGADNPFNENDENPCVVVGISRLRNLSEMYHYSNHVFAWQKAVTSAYPEEGFCIPYWKYMDNEELLERLVLNPQNKTPFKYGSREVENDDAIEVIHQLITVVDVLIGIKDNTEDWQKRKEWLNSLLNELWAARGPYPGFPSVLENLKLHSLVAPYIALTSDDAMKRFRMEVQGFLKGGKEDVNGISVSKKEKDRSRYEYQVLGEETVDFMFDTLSRFALRADQIESIISDERENVSITASVSAMQKNPYIIFEQYVGYDADDTIPLYKIDNGVIPSPEYGLDELLDRGSAERLRAFCADELHRIPAHTFGKAETILRAVNARLKRLPEWKCYQYRMRNFEVNRKVLDAALVQREYGGALYLYLKEMYEDEKIIEQTLRKLADRQDIEIKRMISEEKFISGLRVSNSQLEIKAAEDYEMILKNQAQICMKIFTKPLCVLSGAAGTGKTTVIKAILENISRVHGKSTKFLLLAPTGKAAERIKVQTGKDASTIHSHLAMNGWMNDNYTLKRYERQDDNKCNDVNTIIIDECSMIDLNLFAALMRSINWNNVQRLILIGDPNQLPPIGRGKVFVDTLEWLRTEYPDNVGTLTDNIRQLVNMVEGNGCGILKLADVFIQEHQQTELADENAGFKAAREEMFEEIQKKGNDNVDKDLGVYFWNNQEELEALLPEVMIGDMRVYVTEKKPEKQIPDDAVDELWLGVIKNDGKWTTEVMQVISPYRGEFYGTYSLNLLMQKLLNPRWSQKKLDGIGYHDKVIQIRNRSKSDPAYAYDETAGVNKKAEIFNGEIGQTVAHIDRRKKEVYENEKTITSFQVAFSGKTRQGMLYSYGSNLGREQSGKMIPNQSAADNLELAYAISVHKSQGSEFDYVYIVIPRKESHLLSMELLYTAITRAQKKVTLFVQEDVGTLTSFSRIEKSAVRKINSSVFEFKPLPEELLYPVGNWYESKKNIATLSEYFVRSKSEAIIANLLVDRGISFKYEEPLYAPDGSMYLPDFTVTFRGEVYYWEHVGLLSNEGYVRHWEKKEKWYQQHFPGRLLTTYEGNDLTTKAVELIEKYV